jgi:hypothetical protein
VPTVFQCCCRPNPGQLEMHTYSSDAADRSWAPWALASLAVAMTYGCTSALAAWSVSWPWWIENPSIMLFYGALWSMYNRALWRRTFLGIRLSQVPDLGGTWFATLQSSHNGGAHSHGCVRIHQTWSKLLIEFESATSRSVSRMAALNLEPGANQGLIYEYANDPHFTATDSMHAHRGVSVMRMSTDGRWLKGEYFTGRDRQTHGSIKLERVSTQHLDLSQATRICEEEKKRHERQAAAD